MVELKPASPYIRGRAEWLDVELPTDCTEAEARVAIFNAPLTPQLLKMAERLGFDTKGLPFGPVWPELKKRRSEVEADLLATAGWEVNKWLEWQGGIYLIIKMGFNASTNRTTIQLRPLGAPHVHTVKQGKTKQTKGLYIPLSRSTKTKYPFDLIDSNVISVESLQLY